MGQRLRDARQRRPGAPLPPGGLGSGAAPADGRLADSGRARRGADGGRRWTRRRARDRSGPRARLRWVPGSGADPYRRADRRPAGPLVPGAQEAEALREDALDRLEGSRSARPLLLPVPPASVLLVAHSRRVGIGRDRRDGRVPGCCLSEGLLSRRPLGSGGVRDPARPRVLPDVHARARARRRDLAVPPEGEERGLHDLLRLAGVLRRGDGQPDARSPPADPAVLRRPLHRAGDRGRRRARRLLLPRRAARRSAVQVRTPELPRDLPEPDPAARARWLLDPLGPDPGPGPAAPFAPVRPTRPLAQDPWARAAHATGVGSRRLRGRRDRVHHLLVLHGLLLLASDLRRARQELVATGTSGRRSSSSCSSPSSQVPSSGAC